MTRQEMLDSARQALEFNQGSMVIPLAHVEKFLAAQSDELINIKQALGAQALHLDTLAK